MLTGPAEAYGDLFGADLVVGTSAGALVGAFLACGADLSGTVRSLARMGQAVTADQCRASPWTSHSQPSRRSDRRSPNRARQALLC
ncbi:patatin-like phospholipase family protein [Streptomyces sp. NPDC001093]|uniref:patatin-like phospholipase family protein n=1 Tax=Streptomyces sp. NPDC001093 TaxID=3154376 RepID=UPI00331C1AC9